ncbi:MAG: sigma-70 family RNA polymerase sigma factor [Bacteroidia bacterium]|nr:sigma-70 family RNA polymerase sigma factor [Bacteroidia bacterium]
MSEIQLNPLKWTDKYADDMYRYAFFCLNGDADAACDLVQDTFLSALEKKETFKGIASEKTWLFAILKNKISDHYRKKKIRKETSLDDISEEGTSVHYFYNPQKNGRWHKDHEPKEWNSSEIRLLEKEKYSILHRCLELLPVKWKSILAETYLECKKGPEICKEHDISPSNYWVILHRCKVQLRECIEKKLK